MIVFNIDDLQEFMKFLSRRLNDEIFFYVEDEERQTENAGQEIIKIVLHFLGKVNESVLGLYQTRISFKKSETKERIYEEMKKVIENQTEMKLVSGRISELFISIS